MMLGTGIVLLVGEVWRLSNVPHHDIEFALVG